MYGPYSRVYAPRELGKFPGCTFIPGCTHTNWQGPKVYVFKVTKRSLLTYGIRLSNILVCQNDNNSQGVLLIFFSRNIDSLCNLILLC